MKNITILLSLLGLICSCNQIMIREYESPLDPSFFRNASCSKNTSGSYLYSSGKITFELSPTNLIKSVDNKKIWNKKRSEILYPYGYLDHAVPYMLRDGMTSTEMFTLLGKESHTSRRFSYYKLSNGSELVLFKGTLNMPKGMKSLVIQGVEYNDDIKIPTLKN